MPVDVVVRGTPVHVAPEGAVVVPLAPVELLPGRPSVRDIEGAVREDGSVIRAIVPANPVAEENGELVAEYS
ncbi:MAG TPA: hypothetical protein VLS51_07310 [Propionibacteriaceae bacterium]|nr:hypothetical protein [Propionibacteriaceae bacterium]